MHVRSPQRLSHMRPDAQLERAKLIGLCALMLLVAPAFAAIAGLPRLPTHVPGVRDVADILSGATLPLAALMLLLVDVVWLLWLWIAASLCLELLLTAAEAAAHGAAWLGAVRRFADRVSVPLVRKVVAAAFAVQIVSRGVPIAAAQPLETPPIELVASPDSVPLAREAPQDDNAPLYLVRPGDTLWSIAEGAYGSGAEYRRIVESNVGRRMLDGQTFTAIGVIQPGWQLMVPGARPLIDEADGTRWYTVRDGDTLSGIAEVTLGDRSRWNELFDLNLGATTPDGRHALSDANVIWPELRLRLPSEPTAAELPSTTDDASLEPEVVDLSVASAPVEAAPPPQEVVVDVTIVGAEADLPPLVRTPHAYEPVALQPADDGAGEAATGATPPVADAEVTLPNTSAPVEVPMLPLAAGGLGLAAAAGVGFGIRRLRRLRPLPKEPESDVVVEGGFAEAQLAHDLTRGMHGVGIDPNEVLVRQLERFLDEYNLEHVRLVAVRHGRSSTTLTVQCSLAEQAILVDLAPVFGERLDAEVEATVSADQDVLLRLTGLRKTRLLPLTDAAETRDWLVPLGVLYDKQVCSAAWECLGHVLVVSLPGHGSDTILTSLVATLTARRSPAQLHLWMLGSARSLPAPLCNVPHLIRSVDPLDEPLMSAAVEDLRQELDRRAQERPVEDLVVVLPEIGSIRPHASSLALLASRSAELGVRFVAASTQPDLAQASPLTAQFTTRMVLRMQAEEASVALLGVADAVQLAGGGRLLLRLDGRQPVELYGYQVTSEHLERLVKVMRSAYAAPSAVPPPPPPTPIAQAQPSPQPEQLASENDEDTRAVGPPSGTTDLPPSDGAPIKVVCFGSPRVMCGDTLVWPHNASGDAKPWEFLLYLACQPSEGVSRDAVVEALWPEDELAEDIPHRFRQLRYRLRRAFIDVPGAPASDGVCLDRAALRLDPAVISSDAQEFITLVRNARLVTGADAIRDLELARGLYTADLLDGPDARRYAWVHERDQSGVTLREHFRTLFQQASLRLAKLCSESGMLDRAITLYREQVRIDPGDEQLWLALFRVHAQRADPLSLRRDVAQFRDALRSLAADFNDARGGEQIAEPSRETAEEIEHLLAIASVLDRQPATA